MKLSIVVGIILIFNAPTEGKQVVQNLRNVSNGTTRDVPLGLDVPCGVRAGGDDRIINGQRAGKHEFPWIVSIQVFVSNRNQPICGGSIIHPLWIVTAGHCIYNVPVNTYRIVASIYDLDHPDETTQQRSVVFMKSLFTKNSRANDLAMMKVSEKFVLDGRTVVPICLPDKSPTEYVGPIVQPGWGNTKVTGSPSYHALQKINVMAIPYQECYDLYKKSHIILDECQVCRLTNKNQGTCAGDLGGPGMYVKDGKYYLWSVVSFGMRCQVDKYPGVSADVSCYGDWIVYNIKNN